MEKKILINAAKVVKHMSELELSKYSIPLESNSGVSDHELILEVLKEVKCIKSDVAALKSDVKVLKSDVVSIKSRIDNLVVKNNLVE